MTVFGYLFSALTMYAIPQEEVLGISWKFLYVLIPVACAIGKLSTRSLVMAYFTRYLLERRGQKLQKLENQYQNRYQALPQLPMHSVPSKHLTFR